MSAASGISHAVAALALSLAPAAGGADLGDVGQQDYETMCAVCHGTAGKGKGSYAELLTVPVPDLTTLAKRNGGVFPHHRVYRIVDGRDETKAHGPREMPIWGQDYLVKAETAFFGYAVSREVFVRSRILALIDYLHRLQEK
jgi:mono/diheme cytochrome c family protein